MRSPLLAVAIAGICTSAIADQPESLGQIMVTATRNDISTSDAPGSVTVITKEQIEARGSDNVLDVIRGTTGVAMSGVGTGGRKAVTLRGMESKHTLILVDGKRISSSNDSIGPNTDYQYDWVPVDQIERVEIVRGPMSVLYGADAMGGVVNIITRPATDTWQGTARLGGWAVDSEDGGEGHRAAVNVSGALTENLQLSLGAVQSRRSAVESEVNAELSAIEGRKKEQVNAALDFQPAAGHNVRLEHISSDEERWYNTATRRGAVYESSYDLDRTHTSLGWEGSINDNLTASLRGYQSKVEIVNSASNGVAPLDPQTLEDSVLEANLIAALGDMNTLTFGLEQRDEELQNAKLVGGEDEATLKSVYIQDEIEVTDALRVTAGVRSDDHDVFGSETSPKVSVVWGASKALTLKASYGQGFKAPNVKQVSPGYVFAAGPILINSNPDLLPETNESIELGASYEQANYTVDFAVFNNEVENLIDTRLDSILPNGLQNWVYDNVDDATLKGAELAGRYYWKNGFSLNSNYQYMDAKDGDDVALERRPRHTLGLGVDWESSGWLVHLRTEYLADQKTVSTATRTMVDLPNYSLWNVGLRKSINKMFSVNASIDNLTDVRLQDKSTDFRHEEYPRTLRVELKATF